MAGYAKLFSTITDSSLWSASKDARLLFVTMLAKADQTGFIEASTSGLARAANLTVDETRAALDVLMAPDPESKSKVADGRRVIEVPRGYCLVNYEEHRDRGAEEERREYMRTYMREYRNKHAVSDGSKHDVNSGKTKLAKLGQAEAEAPAKAEAEEKPSPAAPREGFDFDALYAKYPRKEGRKKGLQRFKSQITTRLKYDALTRAVENYAATITDPTYAKHFDTFMGCWEDYVDAGLLTPKRPAGATAHVGHAKPAPHNEVSREVDL